MLSVICLSFFSSVCWPVLRVQLYTESYWSKGSFWYSSLYFCTVSVHAFLTKQVKTFYRSCNFFRAMSAGNVFLRIQNYLFGKVKSFFSSAPGASINMCLSVCYWKKLISRFIQTVKGYINWHIEPTFTMKFYPHWTSKGSRIVLLRTH